MARRKVVYRNGYADWQLGEAYLDKTLKLVEHTDGTIDAYAGDKFLETFTNRSYYNINVVRARAKVQRDRERLR